MWYEIIPSAGIILAAFCVPAAGIYGFHKLGLGNAYRRNMSLIFDRNMYLRDRRLTDNPYKQNRLEVIPDH